MLGQIEHLLNIFWVLQFFFLIEFTEVEIQPTWSQVDKKWDTKMIIHCLIFRLPPFY